MTQRKLNLDELQVESFIASFESSHDGTVKGGIVSHEQPHDTHILVCDFMTHTFAKIGTGGCQHTDNGNMCTLKKTETIPL